MEELVQRILLLRRAADHRLFCDLVGSTALSARLDPEDLNEVMRDYYDCCSDIIEAAGGYVAQFQGEGIVAYFGYFAAHEGDAERATLAGLELVESIPALRRDNTGELQARVGISTGLVLVGDPVGEGTRLELRVIGETVNLAARLQAVAGPGQVVVSDTTRRLAGAVVRFTSLGRVDIKGRDEPLATWQVLGTRPARGGPRDGSGRSGTRLVERAPEIAVLLQQWSDVRAGQGRSVRIAGEAGIGKSRLIAEFRRLIRRQEVAWIECSGSQSFVNTPFYAAGSLLWRLLDPFGRASPDGLRATIAAMLAAAGLDPVTGTRLIAEMLALPNSRLDDVAPESAEHTRQLLFQTIAALLVDAAARRPVILVVEDMHWLDPSSLELVSYLLRYTAAAPMLVIHDAADDDRIRHAQSVAHSNNHPFDEAYADYMAAVHFALVEQFEASRSFAQNSVALSDKFGFPQFAGIARIPLGRALAGLGDHQQGLALIADGLDRMDATSVRVARTMYLTWQADLCLQAGLVDQAMRSADDALSFNPSEAFYRPETLRVRANVLHVIGHTEAAAAARAAARALAIQLQATRLLQHLDRNP